MYKDILMLNNFLKKEKAADCLEFTSYWSPENQLVVII